MNKTNSPTVAKGLSAAEQKIEEKIQSENKSEFECSLIGEVSLSYCRVCEHMYGECKC